jgi:hypothetical protein
MCDEIRDDEATGDEIEIEVEAEDDGPSPLELAKSAFDMLTGIAATRKTMLESITAYLSQSFAVHEDDAQSEKAHLGLRTPVEDQTLDDVRTLYLVETFRSFSEARQAAAALIEHTRLDSRTLSDLANALVVASGILQLPQD